MLSGLEQAVSSNATQTRTPNARCTKGIVWNCKEYCFSKKSRRSLCAREWRQALGGTGNVFESGRPERLPRAFKTAKLLGRSPDLKTNCLPYLMVVSRSLITVARPHGIFTRFPILPNLLGHPDAFNDKEQFVIDADTITLAFTVSIPATRR